MLEEFDAAEVKTRMERDPEFKRLFQEHRQLDKRIERLTHGEGGVDDSHLNELKRTRLRLKDEMSVRLSQSL